jgi:nicotinamidase/pyrazinamidase
MRAIILVDIQNDFLQNGALEVPDGEAIIPIVNQLQPMFDLVVMTQDWHPSNHGSFAANHPGLRPYDVVNLNGLQQVLWPIHCVQNSPGAEFSMALDIRNVDKIFQKGTDPGIDSYSGFFDNGRRKATGMGDYLHEKGVTSVYVCGLATDYCVKFTALDALSLGFETFLIEDASRGVNVNRGDVKKAVAEMKAVGIGVMKSKEILKPVRVR